MKQINTFLFSSDDEQDARAQIAQLYPKATIVSIEPAHNGYNFTLAEPDETPESD